jgi:hypothetical protein
MQRPSPWVRLILSKWAISIKAGMRTGCTLLIDENPDDVETVAQFLHIHDRQIRQTVSGEFLRWCRKNLGYAHATRRRSMNYRPFLLSQATSDTSKSFNNGTILTLLEHPNLPNKPLKIRSSMTSGGRLTSTAHTDARATLRPEPGRATASHFSTTEALELHSVKCDTSVHTPHTIATANDRSSRLLEQRLQHCTTIDPR